MATDGELGGLSWDVWGFQIMPHLYTHDLHNAYALFYVLLKDVDAYYFADANISIPRLTAKASRIPFYIAYRNANVHANKTHPITSNTWSLAQRRRLTILLSILYKALELLQTPTQLGDAQTVLPHFCATWTFKMHTEYYLRPYYAFVEKFAWALPMTTAHFAIHDNRNYRLTHALPSLYQCAPLSAQHLNTWLAWLWRNRHTFGVGAHCTTVHIGLHSTVHANTLERAFALLQYLPSTLHHLNLWKDGVQIREDARPTQNDTAMQFTLARVVQRLSHLNILELNFGHNFSISANISACLLTLPRNLTVLKLHDSWLATTNILFANLPSGLLHLQFCVDPYTFSRIEFAQLRHSALQSVELRGHWDANYNYDATVLSQLPMYIPTLHTITLASTLSNNHHRWRALATEAMFASPNPTVAFWTANVERNCIVPMPTSTIVDGHIGRSYKNMSSVPGVDMHCNMSVPFTFLRSSITRLELHDLCFPWKDGLPKYVNIFWWPMSLLHLEISFSETLDDDVPYTAIWPLPSGLKTLRTRRVSWYTTNVHPGILPVALESLDVHYMEDFSIPTWLTLPPTLTRCTIATALLPLIHEFVQTLPRTLTYLNARFKYANQMYAQEDTLRYLPPSLQILELCDVYPWDSYLRWLPATVKTVRLTMTDANKNYATSNSTSDVTITRYIPPTVQTLSINGRAVAIPSFERAMSLRCNYIVHSNFISPICGLYQDLITTYHCTYHFTSDVISYLRGNRDATTMHYDIVHLVNMLSYMSRKDLVRMTFVGLIAVGFMIILFVAQYGNFPLTVSTIMLNVLFIKFGEAMKIW